jgi:hypothetical protein
MPKLEIRAQRLSRREAIIVNLAAAVIYTLALGFMLGRLADGQLDRPWMTVGFCILDVAMGAVHLRRLGRCIR